MLRAANSIYSPHFAVWPKKRSVLESAVCHLAACSDNNVDSPIYIFFAIAYFYLELDKAQKRVGPTKDSVKFITQGLQRLESPSCSWVFLGVADRYFY